MKNLLEILALVVLLPLMVVVIIIGAVVFGAMLFLSAPFVLMVYLWHWIVETFVMR